MMTQSRKQLILRSAMTAAAFVRVPSVSSALAAKPNSDIEILNYLLTVEHLESKLYKVGVARLGAKSELGDLLTLLADHESRHVDALASEIRKRGGRPVSGTGVDFPFQDREGFIFIAQGVEDVGVAAYHGAIPRLESTQLVELASSIVQVEARHAAAIRLQHHAKPAPEALDPILDEKGALGAISPYISG